MSKELVYMKKKNKKDINTIINNIEVDKDINIREAYDDAIKYEMNKVPIEIRENKAYRLLVNNMRHEHTNYDKNLKNVYHINNSRYYNLYKNTVLNKISSQYPYLYDECNKQLQGRVVAKVVK